MASICSLRERYRLDAIGRGVFAQRVDRCSSSAPDLLGGRLGLGCLFLGVSLPPLGCQVGREGRPGLVGAGVVGAGQEVGRRLNVFLR